MNRSFQTFLGKIRRKLAARAEPEVYVLSYPKSGRTWLRALIGKYLSLKYRLPESELLLTETMTRRSGLPKMAFTHDGSAMIQRASYREMSFDREHYRNKKVILLGRDPKDTLVSAYFHATKRAGVFAGTISEFIATEQFGILKLLTFYEIWLRNRHVPREFLCVCYEDMHQDPKMALRKVLRFSGEMEVDETALEQSIEYCRFENLRKLEAQNKFNNGILKAKNLEDQESYKTRQGKVGGHAGYLSQEDQALIDEAMERYGFGLEKFYEE